MRKQTAFRIATVVLFVGALTFAGLAFSRPRPIPGPGPSPCPWSDLNCLDVWDPVTCDDGVTYSNACYALRACATGCEEGYPNQ